MDTVTQWQIVGCVETIPEAAFCSRGWKLCGTSSPRIRRFHCDNGPEFLNHTVAKLLNKLLVEFTKSRAYRTTDNALVEGKNRAVICKQIGYGSIAEHADAFQQFYTADRNPSWNFHRPCGSATIRSDARGKRKRIYPHQDYCPPYEKLRA
jgi:hypothetical protein